MPRTLLLPVDLHDETPGWLTFAVSFARELGARVLLLHVVDYLPMVMPIEMPAGYALPQLDVIRDAAEKKLDELAGKFGDIEVETQIEVGAAAATVVEVARDRKVDQIVIGSHSRHGLARVVLGSVAERVARTSPCPVTIVPATAVS